MNLKTDFVIVGCGIIGLTIAKNLINRFPQKKILLIDKERQVGLHGSGRNSGVLHAGFYYTKDSLKAKFTKDGNLYWREYCERKGLLINRCGKVVVIDGEEKIPALLELKDRADKNGVRAHIIDEKELQEIDPNAKTYKIALWSPDTATVNPVTICESLEKELRQQGINFLFNTPYKKYLGHNTVKAGKYIIEFERLINAAGLYADKIAKDFGYGNQYVIIPFKGLYLEYSGNDSPISTNIYPVPDLNKPFLGTHFTIKVDGKIKLGPTAVPVFWRENYKGISNFDLREFLQVIWWDTKLFFKNSGGFRDIAFEEVKKYHKKTLAHQALSLVKHIDITKFNKWGIPGIRAQLLDINKNKLVMDFIVEGDEKSLHILNAVSPAFTASYPFTKWVIENFC